MEKGIECSGGIGIRDLEGATEARTRVDHQATRDESVIHR